MSRVVHFEIPANDPEKVAQFYATVFDWRIQQWGGPMDYWIAITGGDESRGINGAFLRKPHPGATVVNTIEVKSIDDAIMRVVENHGQLVVPKSLVPSVGWVAYCSDPDGNTFGLLQPDSEAK